uniref:Uncharacterized protein n=1 Tax=Ralstonia syzygii R24 TaxID=907261 RepID=G3AAG7_9RALS|nr:hypothetical protein RALSY_mp10600 [Ralstonia syzygii R24]
MNRSRGEAILVRLSAGCQEGILAAYYVAQGNFCHGLDAIIMRRDFMIYATRHWKMR